MGKSRLMGFLGKALKNKSNISEVRGPYKASTLDEQLASVSSFVEGATAEIILNSYIYVSEEAVSVSGQGSEERLVLHPGYYYFDDQVTDTVDTRAVTALLAREATKRFAQLTFDGDSLGWFAVLTATDRTQGYVKVTSTFDGVAVTREIQVAPDRPVVLFVPARNHNVNEQKNYGTTGTGTNADPFVVQGDSAPSVNNTKALFKARAFTANTLNLEYQDVQIEAEVIPATSPYIREFFSV